MRKLETGWRFQLGRRVLFLLIALACAGRLAAQVAVQPPVVSGGTAAAIQGSPFGYPIIATNSPTSFAASNLPDGLIVNPSTGTIGGIPTESGTFTLGLSATNSGGTGTATLILTVLPTPPGFNSSAPSVIFGQEGQPFTYQITASNMPSSFSASHLPAGLSVDTSTGVISGTPSVSGTFNIDISATNIAGTTSDFLTITLASALQVVSPNFEILQSFGGILLGAKPLTPVILGSDGNIYGTTYRGGGDGAGTVYKVTPAGAFTNLYTFTGQPDGSGPNGALIQGNDGNIYGAAQLGGDGDNDGTLYKITPAGVFTIFHAFTGGADGGRSSGLSLGNDGNFYGTTSIGGSFGANGTVYQITPSGVFTTLHIFAAGESNAPAGVIQGSDGNLYGTTYSGLSSRYGTVFEMTLAGVITPLHTFTGGADGAYPTSSLIQGDDGNFYGTTYGRGKGSVSGKYGTVFKITSSGALTTLHVFTGAADGSGPNAALIQGADGNFYGTTSGGGDKNQDGTIFEITSMGVLSTLYQFSGSDGSSPQASLTQANDGNVYGTTELGGQYGLGVAFRLTLPASPVVTLAATVPQAVVGSGEAGEFTLGLPAPQSVDVVVNYTIKGSAINGLDYDLIGSSKKIKAGETSKIIKVIPEGHLEGASQKVVTLALKPGNGYTIGTTGKVKVKILSGAGQ